MKFRVVNGSYSQVVDGGFVRHAAGEEFSIEPERVTDRHARGIADIVQPLDEEALALWARLDLPVKKEPTVVGKSYTFGM